MQKISQESLRELNSQLDASQLMTELGSKRVEARGDQLAADCPLEPGVKGALTIEVGPNFATCSSKSCAANQRRSLLWIYCKATGQGLQEGAQALAAQTGVLLEYEGEEPPAAPKVIEIAHAPAEIGPIESASLHGEHRAQGDPDKKYFCPLLKSDCIEDGCRLWVVDWIEEKNIYRRNCAISLIAIGLIEGAPAAKKK